MTPSQTFIKAAEVWIPSDDGSMLELAAGHFGQSRAFAALSRNLCFGRGEGLPGRAWDEGRPVMLRRFEDSYFRRAIAARILKLSSAVALPFFDAGRIRAVLVIFCAHVPHESAALELWHADSGANAHMMLVDGAYGENAPEFEIISRGVSFPRRVGLPGIAWEQGTALFSENIGAPSSQFMRARAASDAGLLRGLAVPVRSSTVEDYVLTFLAGAGLPLAHRIERWVPDESRASLRRVEAFSELHGGISLTEAVMPLEGMNRGTGSALAQALYKGIPVINERPAGEPGPPAAAAAGIGAKALVVIPMMPLGVVRELLALYL
jgi:hypothetical protein